MAFNWYSRDLDKGHAGMIANTTIHNVDSFIVAENAGIEPGDPVIRVDDHTVKTPETAEEAAKVIGVAVHQHKEPQEPYYAQNEAIPVMTMGDIYVPAHTDITVGDNAGVNITDDKRAIFTKGTVTAAVAGKRSFTVTTNFVANDTVQIEGVTFKAVATGATGTNFNVGADIATSITNLVTALTAYTAISDKYTIAKTAKDFSLTEKTAGGGNTPAEITVTGTGKVTNGKATSSISASSTVLTGFEFMESVTDGEIVRLRIRK